MAFPKIEEVRNLTDSEIVEEIMAAKRKLFELRLEKATGRLEKPHQFKHTRHRLAQLLTVEHERKLAQESTKSESNTQTPTTEETKTSSEEEQE